MTTEEAIFDWFDAHGRRIEYGASENEPFSLKCLHLVDSPSLLEDLFEEISGASEIYRKPIHSTWLTEWLIEKRSKCPNEIL
jgi:hypothetical protein